MSRSAIIQEGCKPLPNPLRSGEQSGCREELYKEICDAPNGKKYDAIAFPEGDTWGLIFPSKDPLAQRETIHGCFWHQHEGCKDAHLPKSRTEYWVEKLKKNTERDRTHEMELRSQGWKVVTIWACEVNKEFEGTMNNVIKAIKDI